MRVTPGSLRSSPFDLLRRFGSGSRRLIVLMMITVLFSSPANASLQVPAVEPLQQVGVGNLRKFGFRIYEASTWASQAALPADGSVPTPFALQIVYARAIAADDLIEATVDAWEKLGLLDAEAKRWLPQLAQLWPDVKDGDCLVLYIEADGGATFYFNGTRLGQIADTRFGPRFAAIWLHPKTSEPSLRRQLLGATPPGATQP